MIAVTQIYLFVKTAGPGRTYPKFYTHKTTSSTNYIKRSEEFNNSYLALPNTEHSNDQ